MKYSSFLLSSAFLASSLSYADYQFELDAALAFGSGTSEYDYGYGTDEMDYDTSGMLLGATAYFGSVKTSDVPLQEAAFLSKQSYGSLVWSKDKVEWDDGDDSSTDVLAFSARAVIKEKVIVGAAMTENRQGDGRVSGLEAGAYIADNNAVVVSYSRGKAESSFSERKSTSFGVLFEQVNTLGASKNVAWHVGFEKIDFEIDSDFGGDSELNSFGVQAGFTFYFTNELGVGANILTYVSEGKEASFFDDYEYDGAQSIFLPHLTYDFNEHVGVYLVTESQVTVFEYDDGDEYTDASLEYTFGLNVRF